MALLINGQAIAALVSLDGLPRVAMDDEAVQHVLYLDGASVRSMLASVWPPPLPVEPTTQQSADAIAAREAARQTALAAAATKRAQIVALAQSAVGIRADLLTAAQLRALFGIILWEAGALDATLNVRPLAEWVQA